VDEDRTPEREARAATAAEGSVVLSTEERGPLLVQMWADFFRYLGTIGVAASAGLLVLREMEVLTGGRAFWISLSMMACGTVLALHGAWSTLELVEKGGGSTKSLKRLGGASGFLMGIGAGYLIMSLVLV